MSRKDDPVDEAFRTERAKRAAAVRWEKARIEERLWKIAEGYQAADPRLTRAQAFTKAVTAHPDLYEQYNNASARMPSVTAGEMEEAYQKDVRDLCALAGHPEMAGHFLRNRVAQRDIVTYFLDLRKQGR
ncbi:MAG: hypothetical protein ACE15B_06880 [Bryobacteraceae bacterium]